MSVTKVKERALTEINDALLHDILGGPMQTSTPDKTQDVSSKFH